ncbi:MAG: PEGA domain-containing protein [Chitinophagales bacterium]
MRKSVTQFVVLALISMIFTQCATIISGSRQIISIESEPKKAKLLIDGIDVGYTPYATKLARRSTHQIELQLEGYETYHMKITKTVNGWIFGNILIGGLVGIAIDGATGSMFSLRPSDVYAQMNANPGSKTSLQHKSDGLYFTLVLKADEQWRKIGQLDALGK